MWDFLALIVICKDFYKQARDLSTWTRSGSVGKHFQYIGWLASEYWALRRPPSPAWTRRDGRTLRFWSRCETSWLPVGFQLATSSSWSTHAIRHAPDCMGNYGNAFDCRETKFHSQSGLHHSTRTIALHSSQYMSGLSIDSNLAGRRLWWDLPLLLDALHAHLPHNKHDQLVDLNRGVIYKRTYTKLIRVESFLKTSLFSNPKAQ